MVERYWDRYVQTYELEAEQMHVDKMMENNLAQSVWFVYVVFQHPSLQALGTRVVDSFSQLFLRDDIVSALDGVGVTHPTVIQMLAIPKIAAGKNVLCAAETGKSEWLSLYIAWLY